MVKVAHKCRFHVLRGLAEKTDSWLVTLKKNIWIKVQVIAWSLSEPVALYLVAEDKNSS